MTTCNARRWRPGVVASALGLALSLAPAPGHAQQQGNQATARALFEDARKLMRAEKYESACPKLEAAAKLYPGSGVMLNLADCYEHTGRTASAWSEFGAAAEAAARAGRADDEAEARHRQQTLEPRLSHLVVHVARDVPGLAVARNGTELDRGAWDTAIPVDPGTYSLTASAAGHTSWSGTVSVRGDGATVTTEVPPLRLDDDAQPSAAAEAPEPAAKKTHAHAAPVEPAGYWTGGRAVAAVVTGLGVAGLGAGGVLGLLARGQFEKAETETGAAQRTQSAAAVSTGNVGTGVAIASGAITAAALIVWVALPGPQQASVGTDGRGVLLRGTF